jgi:hypothetical protein
LGLDDHIGSMEAKFKKVLSEKATNAFIYSMDFCSIGEIIFNYYLEIKPGIENQTEVFVKINHNHN